MENHAKMILSNPNAFLDVVSIINEKCKYGKEINVLSKSEKALYLIASLEGEVNNGGLSQYLFNSIGKDAFETVSTLKDIGAVYTASLLEEAISIYKNGPTNDGRNEPEEDDLTEEQEEKLNELDNKFLQYNDNLFNLQLNYIKHLEEI